MSALPVTVTVELTEVNCGECGGTYAINERYRQQRQDCGGTWTCPYCKVSWGYVESALQKKQRELEAEKARHASTLSRLNENERKVKRLERRAKAGVCPCCNRTFVALARHIKARHPEYGEQ